MSESASEASRAETEAARWMAELSSASVTIQALDAFREWRRDPANDAAYRRQEQLRAAGRRLTRDPDIAAATREALARPAPWARRRTLALLGAAATALTVGAVAVIGIDGSSRGYATEPGEQTSFRLADGTRVNLNTDSRLQVRYAPDARRLVLERGEAFFDVAHNPARPFIVQAGDTEVRALGTRFDVRRDPQGLRVTLLEGAVEVRRDGRAWTLRPNEELRLGAGQPPAAQASDAARATSWTTGRLNFRDTPLAEAVAEVNRYGERPVELAPGAPGDKPVSGVFEVGDTEAFVQAVSLYFGLEADTQGRGPIRLAPKGRAAPS